MLKKILISVILFYFLALLQTSFLVHFSIWGIVPNLILILVVFWNLLEKAKNSAGLFNGLIAGFFLDVFSSRPMGFYILISGAIAIFIKFVFKKHVRVPFIDKD